MITFTGTYLIIHLRFNNRVLCLNKFQVRHPQSSDTLNDVFLKEIKIQNLWNFELGSQERMNVPIWIIVRFQQRDTQDSQDSNNDNVCRLPVTSDQCSIGTEKYPDNGTLLNYIDDFYSQGYAEIKEVFRASTKDDILQPYISDDDFRSLNTGFFEIGCKL